MNMERNIKARVVGLSVKLFNVPIPLLQCHVFASEW